MEPPSLTLTDTTGCEARRTVKFQCGLLRETETFIGEDLELLSRDTLLDYACDMLNNKFPEHPYGDLTDKVVLYVHDSADHLVPMEADDPVKDGIIVEIILKARAKQEYDDVVCPHILVVNTYRTPGTFCDYCGTLLFGLLKQGLKCEGCDKNYHKKCAYRIPNNCTRLKNADGVSNPPLLINPTEVWSGRPLWIDRTLKSRPQVPHTFFIHTIKKPAQCFHCKKTLKGVFRQVLRCKDCNILVHKRCAKEISSNCAGEVPSLNRVDSGEWTMATIARHVIANDYSEDSHEIPSIMETGVHTPSTVSEDTREETREDSPLSSCSGQDQSQPEAPPGDGYVPVPPAMGVITEETGGEDTASNDGSEHNQAEMVNSTDNIRLQRVTGVSMRHAKALPASVIKEGWMVHYTNKCNLRKKYYWRLDTKCLTLFKSETGTSYHVEISLVDILAVDQMVNPEVYPLRPPHVFDIVTQTMTYYVGVDMTGALPRDLRPEEEYDENCSGNLLGDVSHMSIPQLEDWGVGLNMGIAWEEALHGALMPITPQASMGSLADVGVGVGGLVRPNSFRKGRGSLRGSFHGNRGSSFRGSVRNRKGSMRGSFRVPKQGPGNGTIPSRPPPTSTAASLKQPKVETKMDISLFYQIFPEELLGSGQFGTVYGGQSRQTGTQVAVKVIDKLRFPHKHESQLRTEVTILQNLNHPGIIHLEQMFETAEKIYVVMEKMNGDMLEMILNSEESRLSERLTKYMIYQILTALQYLHKKDIVHCDLKPENVLLTSETGMPQAKLCDFGFARIIGEKSFRKSIVGTPAYLAPEVLKNEGYNRSLDLWSVGVIVYVSLSGTFPFNEDEEISDQIHNAAFMYPPDPWAGISKEAIDIINRLLQVSRKSRFRISQALNHPWLGDKTLWEDLCKLEGSLGMRYLTHESEDNFWTSHGAKPHPLAQAAEAEKKARALSASEEASSGFKVVKFSQNHEIAPLSSPVGSNGGLFPNKDMPDEGGHMSLDRPDDQDGRSSTSSGGSKKDYVNMTDEEIMKAQEHAKRVGYKVSTV